MKKFLFLLSIVFIAPIICMEPTGDDSLLFEYIELENFLGVQYLLAKGTINVTKEFLFNGKKTNPLSFALSIAEKKQPDLNEQMQKILLILRSKTDTSEKIKFFTDIRKNDIEAIKKMIETKAIDINTQRADSETPIIHAIQAYPQFTHKEILLELLHMGADINIATDITNDTPLTLAIKSKKFEVIQILLNNALNVHIDQKNRNGETPLILAVEAGDINTIKAILAEVPDPFIKQWGHLTAIDFAHNISDETKKKKS